MYSGLPLKMSSDEGVEYFLYQANRTNPNPGNRKTILVESVRVVLTGGDVTITPAN